MNRAPNHRKNHARNSCLRENPSKNRTRLNNKKMQDVRKESRSKETYKDIEKSRQINLQ